MEVVAMVNNIAIAITCMAREAREVITWSRR